MINAGLSSSLSLLRQMSNMYLPPAVHLVPSASTAAPVDAAKLWHTTPAAKAAKPSKAGSTHLFFGDDITALSSLGDKFAHKKGDERREVIRQTVGSAVKKVRDLGNDVEGSKVLVDASLDPHAAGAPSMHILNIPRMNVLACSCRRAPRTLQVHPQNQDHIPVRPPPYRAPP